MSDDQPTTDDSTGLLGSTRQLLGAWTSAKTADIRP